MNITSAQYQNNPVFGEAEHNIVAIIDGETLIVPLDPANRHYAEIMRQVEAGTLTIAEAE
jgi:DNA polymerase III epsilon subunit-like protein